MDLKDFCALAEKRQSCREFDGRAVEKDTLDKIMRTAALAPSACNSQPWKLICASDDENADMIRTLISFDGCNPFLKNVRSFIAVVETEATLRAGFDSDRFVKYDVGEITAYITLAAASSGVASCIIGRMKEEELRGVLGLNDGEICRMVVALGYSDIPIRKKSRKPAEDVIKYI